jgi:hypothetical protein
MVAWKLFSADARGSFRTALSVDEPTWARARGWALSQALVALAYYTLETNPVLVREAGRWLAEVVADHAATSRYRSASRLGLVAQPLEQQPATGENPHAE